MLLMEYGCVREVLSIDTVFVGTKCQYWQCHIICSKHLCDWWTNDLFFSDAPYLVTTVQNAISNFGSGKGIR